MGDLGERESWYDVGLFPHGKRWLKVYNKLVTSEPDQVYTINPY